MIHIGTSQVAARRRRSWFAVRTIGALFAAIFLLGGGYLGGLQLTGNFHTVLAGELYRSAQPSAADIERYAKEYGIQTIINLRGGRPGQEFYDAEKAESEKLGITSVDFPLSASRKLAPEQVRKLVTILRTARQPILVHCKNGADRAGLASALFLKAVAGQGADVAGRQLSLFYGHFSVPGAPSYPMDETWTAYVAGGRTATSAQ